MRIEIPNKGKRSWTRHPGAWSLGGSVQRCERQAFFEEPQGKKNKKPLGCADDVLNRSRRYLKKKTKIEDAVDAVYAVTREPRRGFSSSRLRSRRSFETNRHCSPSILKVRICDRFKIGTKSDLPDPRRVAVKVSSRGCVG